MLSAGSLCLCRISYKVLKSRKCGQQYILVAVDRHCSVAPEKASMQSLQPPLPPVSSECLEQLAESNEEKPGDVEQSESSVGVELLDKDMERVYSQFLLVRQSKFPKGESIPLEETVETFSAHKGTIPLQPPKLKNDWMGPMNLVSKLYPVIFCIQEDETPLQKRYRVKRETVQEWNQNYWHEHNVIHQMEKAAFVEKQLKKKNPDSNMKNLTLTGDEMAEFYRHFSNSMCDIHAEYSKLWYRKNIEIIGLAFLVWCQNLWRKIKK